MVVGGAYHLELCHGLKLFLKGQGAGSTVTTLAFEFQLDQERGRVVRCNVEMSLAGQLGRN